MKLLWFILWGSLALAAHRSLFAALTTGPQDIPERFRGEWRLESADGSPLPASCADYEVDLRAAPSASVLYKNKGISRLALVKGASVSHEGATIVIRFEGNKDWSLVVKLSSPEKGLPVGKLIVTEQGQPTREADVRVVERK